MPPGTGMIGNPHVVRFLSRVKSASGNRIELERSLPYDVRPEWTPEIHRFVPSVQEFGVEHLSIHFPWSPYPGHFKEQTSNGRCFPNAPQCTCNDIDIQHT